MANETVVKVGADASGYTTEIEKARKSARGFISDQNDLAQRTSLAQQAIAEATASGSTVSVRAIKNFTDALSKQASVAGLSKAEILALKATNLGLSDSVKPYIDQIASAAEHTHGFSLETSAAKREIVVLAHELSQGNIKNFGSSLLVLAERTGAFTTLLQPAVLATGAFVAVFAVAAHAVLAAREELADYGETVEKISKTTGLSTDDVQKFGFAASTVGVATKDAADALAGLTKAQNEAQHGNKDSEAAFKALGISMSALKTSSPDQLLAKVADAFARSADGAGKAAVANELFGSSGKDLIPLLDQGSTRLAQLGVTADSVGAILSGNTIAQLSALKEQMELSSAKIEALTLSAKAGLLPTIINLTNALADNVAMKPLLDDFYTGVGFIVKTAATILAAAAVTAESFAESLASGIAVIGFGITGQFKLAQAAADVGFDHLKQQGQGYADFMSRLWGDTTPGTAHGAAPTAQIDFSKGNNSEKPYQESHGDSLLDQAKQAQAVLEESLSGQEKLTGWAAKEADLRAQIDGFAGKTLTKAQQSVLANQAALLAQYGINAGLEKQIDLGERESKLNDQRYEANTRIQNQNDAIADQHKVELATLGLGTKERQRQVDLLKIETDRQKELADWQKRAITLKLDGTPADLDERKQINDKYDARRGEQNQFNSAQDVANGDWIAGAKGGLQDIIDKTNDLSSAANSTAQDAIGGLGDAIATLATTGKLNFGNLATSLISSMIKIESEALIARAALKFLNFGNGYNDSASTFVGDGTGGFAAGGVISGPGSGTSDSIPIRVSNGESILTAATTSRLGRSGVDALNSGAAIHSLARFATGGVVGSVGSPGIAGGGVVVNLYGAPAGTKVQQSRAPNGGLKLDVIMEQVDQYMAKGVISGKTKHAQATQKQYGLNRMVGNT